MRAAIGEALEREIAGTQSSQALEIIATNVDMAQEDSGPICQDTGMPTFIVHTPVRVNQLAVKRAIREAVAMGFGGKASLIGCKICATNRAPASFFVSVAYDCWAFRRLGVRQNSGAVVSMRSAARRNSRRGLWRRCCV